MLKLIIKFLATGSVKNIKREVENPVKNGGIEMDVFGFVAIDPALINKSFKKPSFSSI